MQLNKEEEDESEEKHKNEQKLWGKGELINTKLNIFRYKTKY